jgi:hypothetical protein
MNSKAVVAGRAAAANARSSKRRRTPRQRAQTAEKQEQALLAAARTRSRLNLKATDEQRRKFMQANRQKDKQESTRAAACPECAQARGD